jgi:predicted nucleotidyltransferase component of viral defense system
MNQALEQSIKERVKAIAQKQNRTFNDVWQEVVLERWLSRLAKSSYRKNFIFKGAMCLLNYINLQRETRDLDFLIKDLQASIENVRKYLDEVSSLDLDDGFLFDTLEVSLLDHTHMQYPGYSISVFGHLGKMKTKIFIDIGVGDSVIPTEITVRLLSTEKAPLFEKDIELWAYPVEAIFAEKLETAVSRSDQNSRMKDYHDLLFLIRADVVDLALVKDAITMTFTNRGTTLKLIQIEDSAIETMQKYWNLYLRSLPAEVKHGFSVDFKKIIDEINQNSIRYGLVTPHPLRLQSPPLNER